ncbi:SIMPL domain-containing protein [uncultured Ilyobacter sp.]|uniref:SIMPL domain-containing protein n=1 Tax=uncultured Ilyobacter sp. TaxID=544433 RepID=UPI0029F49B04|nr:SIMPL domain-containing protein [uncultured Ilyobacter sp.]
MKKIVVLLLFCLSVLSYGEAPITRTINVQGNSQVSAVPDTVTITAMAESIDIELSKAANENNKIIRDAREFLLREGIGKDEIYTSRYTVSQQIERLSKNVPGVRKYFVKNEIVITSKKIDKIGEIITALEKAKINNVQGLSYSSSKSKIYEKEAMVLAYKDAKEKAKAIATLEGFSIVPMSINSSVYFPRNTNYMVQADSFSKAAPAPIYTPKTIDITGNINVTFQLKK